METQSTRGLARILSMLGVLFILAMAFDLMPRKYALFAGIACFIVAGSLWGFSGRRH